MFQSFDATTSPDQGPPRLAALRRHLAAAGLTGCLAPRADRFQGEYVAPADERLAWLTGFTGSAGFACVLPGIAGVFVDGRYRVQVRAQVDAGAFTPVDWPEVALADWLKQHAGDGDVIGFDPWLHTIEAIETLETALKGSGIALVPVENPVDAVWPDRPAPPAAAFFAQPDDLAGDSAAAKRARLGAEIGKAGAAAALITLPDAVAWLLNIRGADIPRNPVPHAMALLDADGAVTLFCDPAKAAGLDLDAAVRPETDLPAALADHPGPVRVEPGSAPQAVAGLLGDRMQRGDDPCRLPKAQKTAAEIAGTIAAHDRDAAAMVRFLAWLDEAAPKGGLTEIDVVTALEGFRARTNALRDISFDTICGAGPNGAIVHYRVTHASNRPVRPGELLLVDSGGQYVDGTTDITRTIAVGDVPEGPKAAFTRVLRGLIGLSRLRFPTGIGGAHIDALARAALWEAGLDYGHGTGHGVGSYLCVHEGPQNLSRRSTVPLRTGMILSIEPGHYREGEYGIRIENLAVVREAPELPGQDPLDFLHFQTLTHVPIDRRLILPGLLSPAEREWLDAYHAAVRDRIGPLVDGGARTWLEAACAPL